MRPYLQIRGLPDKFICAGRSYTVRVTPLVEFSGTYEGADIDMKDRVMTGVQIKTSGNDASVLSVEPKEQTSGAVPRSLWALPPYQPGTPGEVTFKIKGVKAGTTNLYFAAKVPNRFALSGNQVFGPGGQVAPGGAVKVANCEYEVSMQYRFEQNAGTVRFWALGTMTKAPLKVQGEASQARGSGQIEFMNVMSAPPFCTVSITSAESKVDMVGTLEDGPTGAGQISIAVDYGNVSFNASNTCTVPYAGTQTGTADYSGPPPTAQIKKIVMDENGGSRTFQLGQGASLIVTVKPVTGQGN